MSVIQENWDIGCFQGSKRGDKPIASPGVVQTLLFIAVWLWRRETTSFQKQPPDSAVLARDGSAEVP